MRYCSLHRTLPRGGIPTRLPARAISAIMGGLRSAFCPLSLYARGVFTLHLSYILKRLHQPASTLTFALERTQDGVCLPAQDRRSAVMQLSSAGVSRCPWLHLRYGICRAQSEVEDKVLPFAASHIHLLDGSAGREEASSAKEDTFLLVVSARGLECLGADSV